MAALSCDDTIITHWTHQYMTSPSIDTTEAREKKPLFEFIHCVTCLPHPTDDLRSKIDNRSSLLPCLDQGEVDVEIQI